jgi:hypothetical protein
VEFANVPHRGANDSCQVGLAGVFVFLAVWFEACEPHQHSRHVLIGMSCGAAMKHSLDDARLKIARAEEHVQRLEREIREYLDTRPYDVVKRFRGGQSVVAMRVRVGPPRHVSAIAGDCLNNLRASLNLIFWMLALQTGPKDPDRDRLAFPIFADESKFRAAQDGFARYIPTEAAEVVEEVQPFRTRSVALSLLRTLSNQDKHGFLGLTVKHVPGAEPPTACVAFDDPTMPVGSVEAWLNKILQHIRTDVLPKFESFCS